MYKVTTEKFYWRRQKLLGQKQGGIVNHQWICVDVKDPQMNSLTLYSLNCVNLREIWIYLCFMRLLV